MADRGNQDPLKGDVTGKGRGKQGVDKAPREETSQDLQNVVQQTQKGKNKVDGDLAQETDNLLSKVTIEVWPFTYWPDSDYCWGKTRHEVTMALKRRSSPMTPL